MTTLIKATDLYNLAACDRKVYLAYHGNPALRVEEAAYQKWLQQAGREHEQRVMMRYGEAMPVFYAADDLPAGFQATLDLMRKSVGLIYHGILLHDDLVGIPDLLVKHTGPSRLGGHYYRPLDVKWASRLHEGDRLQVMAYIALLEAIQGVRPDGGLLLRLPLDERDSDPEATVEETVAFDAPLYESKLAEVRRLVGGHEPDPFIASVCATCQWQPHCLGIAEGSQDVSLISGLKRSVWAALRARGLGTLPAAAAASRETLINIKGVGEKTAQHITLQARALHERRPIQIARPDLDHSRPALFLDAESESSHGVVYLMGLLIERGPDRVFEYDLARSPGDEAAMWTRFLDRIQTLDGTVYHYAPYERTILDRLAQKHGEQARADSLLDRMVDLSHVLKDSVVLPLYGYSLKEVAPWLGFEWTGQTQAADDSMLEYLGWLDDGDPAHLDRILRYNEEDCRALAVVFDWLLTLRDTG